VQARASEASRVRWPVRIFHIPPVQALIEFLTQHPAPSTQHPAPSTQHPAPSTQHPAPSTQHPALALGLVFAAALLESVAVFGTVVPGSSVVVAAGVLIGLQALDSWWAAGVAVIGATLGGGFSYWLGRHYHDRLRAWWPFRAYPEWLSVVRRKEQRGGAGRRRGRFGRGSCGCCHPLPLVSSRCWRSCTETRRRR
jgi:hypothetical protein